MARRRSGFQSVMDGYNFGVNAVKQFQDAQIEADAGKAYEHGGPTEGLSGQDTLAKFNENYVAQEGGPATAAEYLQQHPELAPAFADTRKADWTLNGKTQDKQFGDGEIEAARSRASADVYAKAGKFKEASTLRRDAAQMGLTEMQLKAAQREEASTAAMDAAFAATPAIGAPRDASAAADPIGSLTSKIDTGIAPTQAATQVQSGLQKTTLADQYIHGASVAKQGGAKYMPQYYDLLHKGAAEVSKQAQLDVMGAKTLDELNKGAFSKIDNGLDLREVPAKGPDGKPNGRVTYEFVGADGKATRALGGGKDYADFNALKADLVVQIGNDPGQFVSHVQKEGEARMAERKFAEDVRKNQANEKTAQSHAGAAWVSARAGADHYKVLNEKTRQEIDTAKLTQLGLGVLHKPDAELTPEQRDAKAMVQNTYEIKNAPRDRAQLDKDKESVDKFIFDNAKARVPNFEKMDGDVLDDVTATRTVASAIVDRMRAENRTSPLSKSKIESTAIAVVAQARKAVASGETKLSVGDAALLILEGRTNGTKAGGGAPSPGAPAAPASAAKGKFNGLWE